MYVQDAKVLTYDTQGLKKTSVVGIVEAKIMRRKRVTKDKIIVERIKKMCRERTREINQIYYGCLLYTSPSQRDRG